MGDEGVSMGANVTLTVKRADGSEEKRHVIQDIEFSAEMLELLKELIRKYEEI
jgi:hypothetical protein